MQRTFGQHSLGNKDLVVEGWRWRKTGSEKLMKRVTGSKEKKLRRRMHRGQKKRNVVNVKENRRNARITNEG